MAKLTQRCAFVFALLLGLGLLAAASVGAEGELPFSWMIAALADCRGSITECLAREEYFDLGMEVARRVIANSNSVGYGALKRDVTPCSRRGASYYNCRPGAHANPYSRSCTAINHCQVGGRNRN